MIFDFFITTEIAAYDFYITALGAFIVSIYVETDLIVQKVPEATNQEVKNIELKCTRCGSILEISNKICPICNETLKDTIEPIPSGQNENSVHTPLDEKK